MKKQLLKKSFLAILSIAIFFSCDCASEKNAFQSVDYVNPYMGNISHMLVPTYPIIHLPNSMLRVYPVRSDHTGNRLDGLPLMAINHKRPSIFNFKPYQGDETGISKDLWLSYDQENTLPYRYQVFLDEMDINVDFAPSHQSAIYSFSFENSSSPYLIFSNNAGEIKANGNVISGFQQLNDSVKIYLYAETDALPEKTGSITDEALNWEKKMVNGTRPVFVLKYPEGTKNLSMHYGISFIDEAQAQKNMEREIKGYTVDEIAQKGRKVWNETLDKIQIQGGTEDEKTVFYTSLYRFYERPVNMSEDGRYFSASDGKVHNDEGRNFYTDDAVWDSYRASHPLNVLINKELENDFIHSYILMAEQDGTNWMPTFPSLMGDYRGMNCNHGVAMVIDAYNKGLRGFDLEKAYLACKQAIEERSLIPWSNVPAGELDDFYKKHGYFPSLKPGEKETVANVHHWEKRQPVAVTLGTAYDQWCLSLIARELGRTEEADHYLQCAYNYRNLFNPETGFFHPKDKDGKFIENVDYRFGGGPGARDYYDENNGYIYRWDVQHNIGDLVSMLGGNDAFIEALEDMYNEPYGTERWLYYAILPDHTGNVGQFSMANEPSFHIPYLYNYAGEAWRTQKRIRNLLDQWFRNDLMGIPGDEDGGGMSSFVVFSQMGFYPVTPGSPTYNIGTPFFSYVKMDLGDGKFFEIKAPNASKENKYIQSAKLNGKPLNQAWFNHEDIANGGVLELNMGTKANKKWGNETPPPSL